MNVRPALVIFMLVAIGFFACQNRSPHIGRPSTSIFADSLYLFVNYTGMVEDTLIDSRLDKGFDVDSNIEQKILSNFHPFDSTSWTMVRMKYYAKLHSTISIQPILVHISADDYGALVLVNFNDKGEVLDKMELSGGLCAGPDEQDDSLLVLCPSTHSVIIDSNHIAFYKIRSTYSALFSDTSLKKTGSQSWVGYDTIPFIDSLSYKLEIKKDGKIVSTFLDSVRIDVHKKINSKP